MIIDQSEHKYGQKYSKRYGIKDGPLHRRCQGTIEQIDEWIFNCVKQAEEGKMDIVRAQKIVRRWWGIREKKMKQLEKIND